MSDWTPDAEAESVGCMLLVFAMLAAFAGGVVAGRWLW